MSPEVKQSALSLAEVVSKVGGELIGDGTVAVHGLCALEEPTSGCIAFARFTSIKKILGYDLSSLAALIVAEKLEGLDKLSHVNLIVVKEPQKALLELVPLFYRTPAVSAGVSPRAEVHPTAVLGKNVSIAAFCSVGASVKIGDNAVLHPQVTIYPGAVIGADSVIHAGAVVREHCRIGARTVIQPGAIVGADGFGYIPDPKRGLVPVPQIGITVLEDEVELGANACVDRATLGTTRVGYGSKLDNLVQIGHNTVIGRHSILCGQSALAGSCHIGNQVVIGGNTGIADHTLISDGVRIGGQSGAFGEFTEAGDYAGYPAVPAREWRKSAAMLMFIGKHSRILRKLIGIGEKE